MELSKIKNSEKPTQKVIQKGKKEPEKEGNTYICRCNFHMKYSPLDLLRFAT